MKGNYLGEFEEIVMLCVTILHGEAYGVAVMDEIKRQAKRSPSISTVHETLARLEKKGMLSSYMGGATKSRGGRQKRFFELTAYGKKAINNSRKLRKSLWAEVPKVVWEAI